LVVVLWVVCAMGLFEIYGVETIRQSNDVLRCACVWNRRGELKRRTRRVVAVVQVDDVPAGAVHRPWECYRKTYKLVPALAAGDKCKVVVKTD
jgi:hypothetical protein